MNDEIDELRIGENVKKWFPIIPNEFKWFRVGPHSRIDS